MNTRKTWSLALVIFLGLCGTGTARAAITLADSYTASKTTPLSVPAPGILENDDCDVCTVLTVNEIQFQGQISFTHQPDGDNAQSPLDSGASLTVYDDGSFVYDPTTLYLPEDTPSDSFTYRAVDSRGYSEVTTVNIALVAGTVGSPPVANADQYSVTLGDTLTVPAPGLLGNDTDADADPLTIALLDGYDPGFSQPLSMDHGTLTIESDGSFVYTPDANAGTGVDEGFSYTASDGANYSNSTLVTISLTDGGTSSNLARVRFEDVGLVLMDSEIGLTGIDQLEIGAASGTSGAVSGAGLPAQTGALLLTSSVAGTGADAREALKGCERMALLAQAQPSKYDLVVEVQSDTPETSFSQGGDGEVIIEVSETRLKCWTSR